MHFKQDSEHIVLKRVCGFVGRRVRVTKRNARQGWRNGPMSSLLWIPGLKQQKVTPRACQTAQETSVWRFQGCLFCQVKMPSWRGTKDGIQEFDS